MQFRILGPLEVADGHGAISFDAPKQRTLLAVLLLHANEVVSSERLIDELWGDSPPATAGKVVQTYVSQLRKALGHEMIVTRPPGYVLQVEEGALDADRFHRLTRDARALVATGRQARAEAVYREALALWRGPPLADVAFESFAANEVEGLDEERLKALMDRIDCDLALGRHHELVSELETLVGQYQLRERLRAQLMLALYRSDRQADALAAYEDARRTLVDELGLEPSADLQAHQRAMLTHDAGLDPTAQAAREAPTRRRLLSRRALVTAIPVLIVVSTGLAFALRSGAPDSTALKPNSVGFIDAKSGPIRRAFVVGSRPSSLRVAFNYLWVATYQTEVVTRFDRLSGEPHMIRVGGHPVSLTADQDKVVVLTAEGRLVQIDPRLKLPPEPLPLDERAERMLHPTHGVWPYVTHGRITFGGGSFWITVPPITVLRVNPLEPERTKAIPPDDGVRGPIAFDTDNDAAWVAGWTDVFPIEGTKTPYVGRGIDMGLVRDLVLGGGSLWVLSGADAGNQTIGRGLRRVDLRARSTDSWFDPGGNPAAVVWTDGSIFVASGNERAVKRVDPANPSKAAQTIPLGAIPTALAADTDGVWVGVG